MQPLDSQQQAARAYFESLRDQICAEFEAIEREADSAARFAYTDWQRTAANLAPDESGGGGTRGLIKGKVFEKAGVNVSTVGGEFDESFADSIHGADKQARGFFATGISLVAHMANPHVPAIHMNLRFLETTKRWFGGGVDLNPPLPIDEDTRDFHACLRASCAPFGRDVYERYSKWADDYFYIPHRQTHRGVGGIFFDHLECATATEFDRNFQFAQAVGTAFLDIFPRLVRRRMHSSYSEDERNEQLIWRGRYAEFNLIYDRGTLFGLKTGGNIDAILMSLPPLAVWA